MRATTVRAYFLGVAAVLASLGPAGADTVCVGDCRQDERVTADEVLTLVKIALGSAAPAACADGGAVADGRVTVDRIVAAIENALAGCPSSLRPTPRPAPSPIGPVQATNLAFNNVLPLIGNTLPSVDTFVNAAVDQGIDPLLDLLAAVDPAIRERIPNGVRLDFGGGTPQPVGVMTGTITATYSNFVKNGSSVSFEASIDSDQVSINGAATPFAHLHANVSAAQTDGGKSTMNVAISGTGVNPADTASGNIVVDTAVCPNYPIGGTINSRINGVSATIRFNNSCNGTFGFTSGALRQINFLLVLFDCEREYWYSSTNFLVQENGHIGDDRSDPEDPPYLTASGIVSGNDVDMRWESNCLNMNCNRERFDGTFVGHLWKDEEKNEWGLHWWERSFIGTYTTRHVAYNEDGSVRCEATRVLDEQQGMDDWYHFLEQRFAP